MVSGHRHPYGYPRPLSCYGYLCGYPCRIIRTTRTIQPGFVKLTSLQQRAAPPLRPLAALGRAPWPAARLFELCLFVARNKTACRTEAGFSIFILKIFVICSLIIFQGINRMAPMITNN